MQPPAQMVGPPPPPPPPPGPPPPPAMGGLKLGGSGSTAGGDPRAALLQSIQKGAKLKKTVTVDKSAPIVSGKVASESSLNSAGPRGPSKPVNGGPALGGLFEGMSSMPKLKPVNGRGNTPPSRPSPPAQTQSPTAKSNAQSTQNNGPMDFNAELTKHLTLKKQKQQQVNATEANLRTNRGPPPQPPTQKNITSSTSDCGLENTDTTPTVKSTPTKASSPTGQPVGSSNKLNKKNATLSLSIGYSNVNNDSASSVQTPVNVAPNKSSLFGPNNSSSSSSPSPVPPATKPVVNHGKPNCAPKPPGLQQLVANGKPTTVARHHSMKSPRSPPIAPTGILNFPTTHFGTLRGPPQQFQSQEAINVNVRQPSNAPVGRPTVAPPKPPSIKPPPPPTPARSVSNTNLTNIPLSTVQPANNNNSFGSTCNVSTLKEQLKNQLNHGGSAGNVSNVFPISVNSSSSSKANSATLRSPIIKDKKLAVNGGSATAPPPLPPHRTSPAPPPPLRQLSNTPSSASTFAPPVPPQRHSSIRTSVTSSTTSTTTSPAPAPPLPIGSQGSVQRLALDLEARFAGRFHNVTEFPSPPPFLKTHKNYPSRNIRTSNVNEVRKQRAPNPPTLQVSQDSGFLQLNSDKLFSSDQSYC